MFTIIIDKFFRKMKLDIESFDFKYVSDEIMSTLSLAQDYPTVFNIQGTLFLHVIFLLKIILNVFVILFIFSEFPFF